MKKIEGYISITLGIVFCASVLVGYMPIPEYLIELTAFSNTLIDMLLIFTGINFIVKEKSISSIFYHMGLVTILLFLIYYMFFIEDDKTFRKILYTPIPVMIYLAFAYIIGRVTGHFVYGMFAANEMNFA